MKAKKYIWSMICVYMAYLTHGMQALIFSQNQVCLLYTSDAADE